MVVYRCEDSLESIFTAIYLAYEEKRNLDDTMLALHDDPILFAEDVQVQADEEKARKVGRTLERTFGEQDYFNICASLASEDEEKAQAVFQTVRLGLAGRAAKGHLLDNLANNHVLRVLKLSQRVWHEIHHLQGFVRFGELENGILYSKIGPKSNCLTFLMPHFADRFPSENFVIYDEIHGLFGVHPARQNWYVLRSDREPEVVYSAGEIHFSELFKGFVETIAIESRKNADLQLNMLPLRFRDYMTEFQ